MRGKSSSSKSKNGGQEIEKLEKVKEPHLSGAYIRSLVKQLTSSRTKDSSNSSEHGSPEGEGISSNQNLAGNSFDGFSNHNKQENPQPPQQHKKQVRRRLHTSRPYQERLLNMAEARREIVTALKFHRASMKQANEKQQLESGYGIQPLESSSHQISPEQKSRRNSRIYASNSSTPNYSANSLDSFSYSPGYNSPYSWPVSPICPPPPFSQENLNFQLPSQTLGLNLNLEDFTNLGTSNFQFSNKSSSIYSSSSFSNTSSSALSPGTDKIPCVVGPTTGPEFSDSGLHPVMDDKEMAEIRSIGEQHQVEWDDTMNLMTSACWFKYLKAMEIGPEDQKPDDYVNSPFDEVMEFPAWLSGNESFLDDHCSDYYLQDPSLTCMDIEEIDGMDGDWFA